MATLAVGLLLCVLFFFFENLSKKLLRSPSQVSFSNGMFYLPRHTMRWLSIPEMLHLLLRSFPESATAESLSSCSLPLT